MKQDLLKLGLGAFAVLILVVILFPNVGGMTGGEGRRVAKNDVAQIVRALQSHKTYCGVYPGGTHAVVLDAISGNNPRRLPFFEPRKKQLTRNGEYLDPWGSPYRINPFHPDGPRAYSIGKDRVDDGGRQDSDDVTSWRH